MALPEEVTLFVNGDQIKVIGNRPYDCFKKGFAIKKKRVPDHVTVTILSDNT